MLEETLPQALPHGAINSLLTHSSGMELYWIKGASPTQNGRHHSRNMLIIREANNQLTLINTIRLNEHGLAQLDALGKVTRVIRLGAFHGRDDAFYVSRYGVEFYAPTGVHDEHGIGDEQISSMQDGFTFPTIHAVFTHFAGQGEQFYEGYLWFDELKLLVTCDSIKNWCGVDEYFDTQSQNTEHPEVKAANGNPKSQIFEGWLAALGCDAKSFVSIWLLAKSDSILAFVSAHGEPIVAKASKTLTTILQARFPGELD